MCNIKKLVFFSAAPLPGDESELAWKCCVQEGRTHFTHSPVHPFSLPTMLSLSPLNPLILPSMLFSPVPPFPRHSPHNNHYLPPPPSPSSYLPTLLPMQNGWEPVFVPRRHRLCFCCHRCFHYCCFCCRRWCHPHALVVVLPLQLPLPLPRKRERVSFQTKQNMRSVKRNMRSERQMAKPREQKRKWKHDKQRRENVETNQKREVKPQEAKHEKQRHEKNRKTNHKGQRKPQKAKPWPCFSSCSMSLPLFPLALSFRSQQRFSRAEIFK